MVDRLTVASANPRMANRYERLIVSGAVNLVGWSVWETADGLGHQFVILTVDICVQSVGPEAPCRVGLSAAVETRTSYFAQKFK